MKPNPTAAVSASVSGGPSRRTRFLINPAAAGGRGRTTWERFVALLPESPAPEAVQWSARAGHAQQLAREMPECECLVAVGGDGTVREVVSGLMERKPEERPLLAIVPCGTGNDVARALGITSLEGAVEALENGKGRACDVMRVEASPHAKGARKEGGEQEVDRLSCDGLLMANVGFTANEILRPWMKRTLGARGGYYLAVVLEALRYRAPRLRLEVDGETHEGRLWMAAIGNVEKVGGGSMQIAPGAGIDDGKLHLTLVPARSRGVMLGKVLPKVASGEHLGEPGVRYLEVQEIRIESEPPVRLDVDGDLFGWTPARVWLEPGALQVLGVGP